MFRAAYAKTRNKNDALDAVQESWVKILQKVETLRDPDKLVQWARTIAHNTAVNLVKKKFERKMCAFDEERAAAHPEIRLAAGSRPSDEFLEMVYCLDEETRKIFLCKFFYGFKDQEIAALMGMPLGTIKARIHRGKNRLKKRYGKVLL